MAKRKADLPTRLSQSLCAKAELAESDRAFAFELVLRRPAQFNFAGFLDRLPARFAGRCRSS